MTRPTSFAATAEAIAYALGEPPDRTDWAVAYVYDDGEVRYRELDDEQEARAEAERSTLAGLTRPVSGASAVRAYVAFRQTRVLLDGTQIVSPWLDAARVTEGK